MGDKQKPRKSNDDTQSKKIHGVSVIASTNRPHFFTQLIQNFARQQIKHKELIIILNLDKVNLKAYRKIANDKRITIVQLPSKVPLGHCLNHAADLAKYSIVSKFDDDDYYAPHYLSNQLECLKRYGADIVGKRACLIYLEGLNKLVLRLPKCHHRYVKTVAGATLMMKRSLVKEIPFSKTSPGECVNFLNRCRARGYTIYSTDYLDYVTVRRKCKQSHTWKVSDKKILSQSILISNRGKEYKKYATQSIHSE